MDNQSNLHHGQKGKSPIITVGKSQSTNSKKENKTDVFGIVSIILAFFGLAFIGLIVGVVGIYKAKKEGYSKALSLIGLILNIVVAILITIFIFIFVVPNIQKAARDYYRVSQANLVIKTSNIIKSKSGQFPSSCEPIVQYLYDQQNNLEMPNSKGSSVCVSSGEPSIDNDVILYSFPAGVQGMDAITVSYWSETDNMVKLIWGPGGGGL